MALEAKGGMFSHTNGQMFNMGVVLKDALKISYCFKNLKNNKSVLSVVSLDAFLQGSHNFKFSLKV